MQTGAKEKKNQSKTPNISNVSIYFRLIFNEIFDSPEIQISLFTAGFNEKMPIFGKIIKKFCPEIPGLQYENK